MHKAIGIANRLLFPTSLAHNYDDLGFSKHAEVVEVGDAGEVAEGVLEVHFAVAVVADQMVQTVNSAQADGSGEGARILKKEIDAVVCTP